MEENEKNLQNEETALTVERGSNIMSFDDLRKSSSTKCDIYTNIDDKKKLFNLESKVDFLLNDCENEMIRVKGVLIKMYTKPLKEPVLDGETGEVLKETEHTMSTILVDDNGKSYATGSKMFAIQLMRFIQNYGLEEIDKGMEIKIVKNKTQNGNKALGFEWV